MAARGQRERGQRSSALRGFEPRAGGGEQSAPLAGSLQTMSEAALGRRDKWTAIVEPEAPFDRCRGASSRQRPSYQNDFAKRDFAAVWAL